MSYTWNQLQWKRNLDSFDDTVRYEVFRDTVAGVDEMSTLIMLVEQPETGVYVLVSDSAEDRGGNDGSKSYLGPEPVDTNPPDAPENLTITAENTNNRAVVSWDAVLSKTGILYHYTLRALAPAVGGDPLSLDPSELAGVQSGEIVADINAVPYLLEYSTDGINWVPLPATADLEYTELDVDVNGPDPVYNEVAVPEKVEDGVGKIAFSWTNPDKDNPSLTRYYRIKVIDNAADLFDTITVNNESAYSPVANPIEVLSSVTDGLGGIEIRYRTATAPELPKDITLTGVTSEYIGHTQIISGTLIVANKTTGTPYLLGTDYTADFENGTITRTVSSAITDGETVEVAYSYNDGVNASAADQIVESFDGTYFGEDFSGSETFEHTGLSDQNAYNYMFRVKDNHGSWSAPVYMQVNVGDFTPPAPPVGLILTAE